MPIHAGQFIIAATLLFVATSSAATAQDSPFEPEGLWRGSFEYVRPDGNTNRHYAALEISQTETGERIGSIRVQAIDLQTPIENIESEGGTLSFDFAIGDAAAEFQGIGGQNSIAGDVIVDGRAYEVQYERLYTDIDMDQHAMRRGLYEMDDGGQILVSPYSLALQVYNFQTFDYRLYIPVSETEFVAGPASFLPVPIESTITFGTDDGTIALRQAHSGVVHIGHRSSEITETDVSFSNGDVVLAGSVIRPGQSEELVPAIVVVWGSGQQDRIGFDALNYLPAIWLARHGIATLIYDKRGVGDSAGSYEDRTMDLLAADMAAAVDYLASQPGIDPNRVGVMVHSQSGIYVPLTAQMTDRVSLIVDVASTVANGEVQEIVRTEQELRADGWPESDIADAVETQTLKFHYARTREGWDDYVAAYNRVVDRPWFDIVIGSHTVQDDPVWDFWRSGNSYEPAEGWQRIEVPVLYLIGDRDTINPVEQNLALLTDAFDGERADLLTVQMYEGTDHSLFYSETGGPLGGSELARLAPFLPDVLDWLEEQGFSPR